MLMPARLIGHLCEYYPAFAAEDSDTQFRLAVMLWKAQEPHRQHRVFRHMAWFSKSDLRAIWRSDERVRRTLTGKHFRVLAGSWEEGYAAAFQPVAEMLHALRHCLDPIPGDLLDAEGRIVRTAPASIDPWRAYIGTRALAWQGVRPANLIPINVTMLMAVHPNLSALEQQVIEALIALSRNTIRPGHIPVRYTQYSTGRLFAEPLSLQFATRAVRAAAMHGCWDYDIQCCHHAILAALAKRIGRPAQYLEQYVEARADVRASIAAAQRLHVETVKKAMLMVVYGAPVSASPKASMAWSLGRVEAASLYGRAQAEQLPEATVRALGERAVASLKEDNFFRELEREIRSLRGPVIDAHRLAGGWVTNPLKVRSSGSDSASKLLAHILQGYEAAALRAIVRQHGQDVLLCMHDGWVTGHRLDALAGEEAIREALGIPLRIEEKQLAIEENGMRLGTADADVSIEIPLEDQELTDEPTVSLATSSRLRGCSSSELSSSSGGLIVSARADWNYPGLKRPPAADNLAHGKGQENRWPHGRDAEPQDS